MSFLEKKKSAKAIYFEKHGYPEGYPYSITVPLSVDLGPIWRWMLDNYMEFDFQWNDRSFYFKTEKEKVFFLLKWKQI